MVMLCAMLKVIPYANNFYRYLTKIPLFHHGFFTAIMADPNTRTSTDTFPDTCQLVHYEDELIASQQKENYESNIIGNCSTFDLQSVTMLPHGNSVPDLCIIGKAIVPPMGSKKRADTPRPFSRFRKRAKETVPIGV